MLLVEVMRRQNGRPGPETARLAVTEQAARHETSTEGITPIAVCIVDYNTPELLRTCLKALRSEAPAEVVIVDNASSDNTAEVARAEYPNAIVHMNRNNPGYGAAANHAIASCRATYVLLLNSDTILLSGALRALAEYLDQNPEVAIAAPRLVNPDGTLQPSCFPFPAPFDFLLDVTNCYRLLRYIPLFRDRAVRTWSHSYPRPVPWVLGAALAIRRDAFQAVAGFDESFFMYYEEVDLCRRLADAGWQVHFAPVTDVIHLGGSSTGQHHGDMTVQLYASLVHYYRRHHPLLRLAALIALVESVALCRLVRDLIALRLTRDAGQHSRMAMNILTWRRLFLGQWRRPVQVPWRRNYRLGRRGHGDNGG